MATYSFNIKSQPKTKYGSKLNAAAHFDYIDRDGAYKNREDLLAYGSGNMPDWAPTPHHYWEAASLYERAWILSKRVLCHSSFGINVIRIFKYSTCSCGYDICR